MAKNSKKAEWQSTHKCIHCKRMTDVLLCEHCGKLSIKPPKK